MKRVKRYRLKISKSLLLVVNARQYRSTRSVRARRKNSEFTFPIILLPSTKELAFSFRHQARSKASAKQSLDPRFTYLLAGWIFIFAGIGSSIHFSMSIGHPVTLEPSKTYAQVEIIPTKSEMRQPHTLNRSTPQRLRIKHIDLDSRISEVGLNLDGTIELPAYDNPIVGWYKFGPSPGEKGPAVIVGHVDTIEGPSIFFNLHKLQIGNVIEIERGDSQVAKFTVTQVKQFSQSNFPTDEIYGDTPDSTIRLITCGGIFDKTTGRYTENTVVFGQLMPPVVDKPVDDDLTIAMKQLDVVGQSPVSFLQREWPKQ